MKKLAYLLLAAAAPVLLAQPALSQGRKKPPADQGQQQGDGKEKKAEEYQAPFPTKMTWILSSLNGKSPPSEATLMLDENFRGTGASGCNTYSATIYPVKGQRLAMGPVAQTKKTCSPDLNNFERAFLTILHTGPTWEVKGSTLTVKSQAGVLIFDRGL